MSFTITLATDFEVITCGQEGCGVQFALTADHVAALRRNHSTFYCPAGHSRWYPGKTDAHKLDEVKAEKLRLESQLEFERQRRQNAETHAKREQTRRKNIQKRADAGLCSHCHRRVKQMAEHIADKHPGVRTTAKPHAEREHAH